MDDKKKKRRVPWHVTLFTGAAWFLLAAGPQAPVLVVSGLMAAGGALYILWLRIRKGKAAGTLGEPCNGKDDVQP